MGLCESSLHSNKYSSSSQKNALEMRDKAYNICREYLSGSWKKISSSDMVFKSVSGGLSNILFYCSLPSTHTPLNGEPSQVLLRMYGQLHCEGDSSENTITESVIFMLLSERKLGPKLYGIFPGGRLEEYIPARAMTCSELRDPGLSAIISRKLANVHSLDVPINKEATWLFETMLKWLETVRAKDAGEVSAQGKEALVSELLGFEFESEIEWLKGFLKESNSPVVFCHNDLQEGNILLPDFKASAQLGQVPKSSHAKSQSQKMTDDRVVLIDFEYCSYNFRGFDLANHFCEWAFDYSNPEYPNFYANLDNYPGERERRYFAKEYLKASTAKMSLETSRKMGSRNSEEHLLSEAAHFTLASHLLWTLWSINNAFSSQIPFGYWEYGKARLDAYRKHKEFMVGSKSQQISDDRDNNNESLTSDSPEKETVKG